MKDKEKFYNSEKFKWAETAIGLFIGLITAFVGNYFGSTNFLSDAFVGFMLPYIVFFPFQIKNRVSDKTSELDVALKKLKTINDCCETLLYECSYKPNMTLYKDVCSKLMSYFSGDSQNDYFYATAKCSRNSINWFFDKFNLAGEFLPLLNERCSQKKITDFKRLFIYEDEDLKNPVFMFLGILHNNTKKQINNGYCPFDFKFIEAQKFRNIIRGYHVSDEMGVWGTHCVFIQTNDILPKGYSFKKRDIKRHKEIFDTLWNNPSVKNFNNLNIDISKFECVDDFEREILKILNNILNNNIQCTTNIGKKDTDLSLLDIKEIQDWVQSSYPRSTTFSHSAGT